MSKMMQPIVLPENVQNFYQANAENISLVIPKFFTSDAIVKDENIKYVGHTEICKWLSDAIAKYKFKAEPLKVLETNEYFSVLTKVSGDFPNSPIEITYQFKLRNNQITALEIF